MILPEEPWARQAGMWRRAEALGFDHAWTYDHLAWRSLRDSPWHSAVPTLAAAAAATTTIRLGTLVASPNFRHPVTFAREMITLDDISGGRIVAGIGAGGVGFDATMLGQPPLDAADRTTRFEEFVELLDRLLLERAVSYRGSHYTADEARTHPGPRQGPRIPFAIASIRPRGMRLAARYGTTWVTTGNRAAADGPIPARAGAEIVREQMDRVDAACVAEGRDPATLQRLVLLGNELDDGLSSRAAFDEVIGAYGEVGITDVVVPWPRPTEPYKGDPSVLDSLLS